MALQVPKLQNYYSSQSHNILNSSFGFLGFFFLFACFLNYCFYFNIVSMGRISIFGLLALQIITIGQILLSKHIE